MCDDIEINSRYIYIWSIWRYGHRLKLGQVTILVEVNRVRFKSAGIEEYRPNIDLSNVLILIYGRSEKIDSEWYIVRIDFHWSLNY